MGNRLRKERRGKGSPRYRGNRAKYKVDLVYRNYDDVEKTGMLKGQVVKFIDDPAREALLMKVVYDNNEKCVLIAPEGIAIGDYIETGVQAKVRNGGVLPLYMIPDGTPIYNIERSPGDGGKFVRSSGGFAKIITKMQNKIVVELPSAKRRFFLPDCRATIGIIAGSGRKEKPFLKAGRRYYAMRAKNKLWPQVSGTSMNAVDHPLGGTSSAVKGGATQASRNAPPGRKVGKIAPKKTGKRR